MKKLTVLLAISVISIFDIQAQTLKTGCLYRLSTGICSQFKYSRSYSGSDNTFITTYTIYEPYDGSAAIIVTATHFKNEKKVVVDVKSAGGGIFDEINKRETEYDTPSLQSFGNRGVAGVLGGDRVPNEIEVKFTSNKYENVKVMEIMGAYNIDGTSDVEYYILDK